jgi:Tfp pilus assembly protein PilF
MVSLLGKLFGRNVNAASAANQSDELCALAIRAAEARDFSGAIQLYDQAIALNPQHAEAYYKRGNALKNAGQPEAAIASYDLAIEFRAGYSQAYCNRGVVQQSLGLMGEALSSYDRAIVLEPADAMAHYNRALLMQERSRWDEALASYNRAVQIDPRFADAQYNRSLALLSLGDFEHGWRGFEWRWHNAQRLGIGARREFTQPLWLGDEPVAGKRLLLYSEGGFGDTLQFCRYASLCAGLGATVILEVPQPLRDLLQGLAGVAQVIVTGSELPEFDYQCPLMSLPLAFRTTLETIPAAPGYLHSDPAKVQRWRALLGERTGPRVGLAWSGNPNYPADARRSIALADWVGQLPPGFQYFRLQRHVREADRAALQSSPFIVSFADDLLEFDNTAALCELMDVVISTDTSVPHLSGALARPTWLLLPLDPDWRWLRNRSDSPWYPTAKLYRQKSAGAWDEVFGRIAADLRGLSPRLEGAAAYL